MADLNTAPVDTDDDLTPIETAFLIFRDAGLRMPPVPHHLADALVRRDESWFSNQQTGPTATNWREFEDRLKDTKAGDYIGFGFVGHGIASNWMAYGLQMPGLAVWLRLSAGHPFQDAVAEATLNNGVLMTLEPRMVQIMEAQDNNVFPAGSGILIVNDEHAGLKGIHAYRGGMVDFGQDITPEPGEKGLAISRLFAPAAPPPGTSLA